MMDESCTFILFFNWTSQWCVNECLKHLYHCICGHIILLFFSKVFSRCLVSIWIYKAETESNRNMAAVVVLNWVVDGCNAEFCVLLICGAHWKYSVVHCMNVVKENRHTFIVAKRHWHFSLLFLTSAHLKIVYNIERKHLLTFKILHFS